MKINYENLKKVLDKHPEEKKKFVEFALKFLGETEQKEVLKQTEKAFSEPVAHHPV